MKLNPVYVGLGAKAVHRLDEATGLPDPVVKAFVDEEVLEGAVFRIQEDSEWMISRLAQVEENHPGLEKLEEVICYSFPEVEDLRHLTEQARANSQTASQSLDDINGLGTAAEFVALLVGAGALSVEGVSLPAGVVLAAKAGLSLKEIVGRVQDAQGQVDELVKFSCRLHWTRQEFDVVWDKTFSEEAIREETTYLEV